MPVTQIRSLRQSRGLTLVEVARVVGIDNGNLSRIERGLQLPDVRLAKRLAAFFQVSLDDIYAHVEIDGGHESATSRFRSPDASSI